MLYIATIWKNPVYRERIIALLQEDVSMLRIKFAHLQPEEVIDVVRQVQKVISEHGTHVPIMLDMPESKLRLATCTSESKLINPEKTYVLCPRDTLLVTDMMIPVETDELSSCFAVGDVVIVGDGELSFQVEAVVDQQITIRFTTAGTLMRSRSLYSSRILQMLNQTDTVCESIHYLQDIRPEYLGISFVESAAMLLDIRTAIRDLFGDTYMPKLIAKIESPGGIDNAKEIYTQADMVCIARGDLALTTPFQHIPTYQKKLCQLGVDMGVPVVVATQIMDSLLTAPIPTRPDVADVVGIINDQASGFWFSTSTAHNEHPEYVIQTVRNLVKEYA